MRGTRRRIRPGAPTRLVLLWLSDYGNGETLSSTVALLSSSQLQHEWSRQTPHLLRVRVALLPWYHVAAVCPPGLQSPLQPSNRFGSLPCRIVYMRSAGCRLQAVARARRGGRRMASDPRDHHSWVSRSSRGPVPCTLAATPRLLKGQGTAIAGLDVRHSTNTPWTIVRSDTARCAAIHLPAPRPLVPNLPIDK